MTRLWVILCAALLLGAVVAAARPVADSPAGLIGAGLGAATGAVTGGSALGGAVLGGAAGAATGVLTDEDDVDLGEPVWD